MAEDPKKLSVGGEWWRGYRRSWWQYQPWYDENADYNTNAKSYYDYLAKVNKFLKDQVGDINELLYNMHVPATLTIDNETYIKVTSSGKDKQTFKIINKDLVDKLKKLDDKDKEQDEEISKLKNRVTNLENRVTNLENNYNESNKQLQKIINNLINSGAWENNDIKNGMAIAYGNINTNSQTLEANKFGIFTHKNRAEKDLYSGLKVSK